MSEEPKLFKPILNNKGGEYIQNLVKMQLSNSVKSEMIKKIPA